MNPPSHPLRFSAPRFSVGALMAMVVFPELAYGCWWFLSSDLATDTGRHAMKALMVASIGAPIFAALTVLAIVALFRPPRLDIEADRLVIRGIAGTTRVPRTGIAQIVRLTEAGPPAVAILCKPGRAPLGWGRLFNRRHAKVDLILPTNLNISDAKLHALLTDWLAQP